MVGGGGELLTEILGQPAAPPRWSKIADFEPISARDASAVTLAKKVQLTLTNRNPPRAFQ